MVIRVCRRALRFKKRKLGGQAMQLATYELKYCERCGSLGLRRAHVWGNLLRAMRTNADQLLAFQPCADARALLLRKTSAKTPAQPSVIPAQPQPRCHVGGCNEATHSCGQPSAVARSSRANKTLPRRTGASSIPGRRCCASAGRRSPSCGIFSRSRRKLAGCLPCWGGNFSAPASPITAIPSFEEQAVFVRDVELCLARLSDEHAEMITLVGLYSFSRDEVAEMLRYSKTLGKSARGRSSGCAERNLPAGRDCCAKTVPIADKSR